MTLGNLRRQLTVADELPALSITGRLDQAFERLILESGIDASGVGAFALMLVVGLLTGGTMFLWKEQPLPGIVGMLIGMGLVLAYFMVKRGRRLREIQEQLPDVLDLMSRAVRAGESLDQAIELVGREMGGALGAEYHQCWRQLEMGVSLTSVMRGLMRRVRLLDVRILATTLMVHRQTGGNLALTLERLAAVVRERLNYRRQLRAATGSGRMASLLIGSAGPLMFFVLFSWQFDHLTIMFEDWLGQTLLVTAVVLELIGMVWILRLLHVER
jgi:tight adherence protein B